MDWSLPQIAISLTLGGAIGFISGLLGIGGGLLAVPILVLFYGLDQQLAQGTALMMMTPNMIIGFLRYRQKNPITFGMVGLLAAGSVVASYFAALLAAQAPTVLLRKFVAVYMMLLAGHMLWRSLSTREVKSLKKAAPFWMLPLAGGVGGACMGFFSIGGGVVVVPILTGLFLMTQTSAQGLVLAMLVPSGIVALSTYAWLGLVYWPIAIPLAAGSVLTVAYGVQMAHKLPEKKLRAIFSLVLFTAAMLMLFR